MALTRKVVGGNMKNNKLVKMFKKVFEINGGVYIPYFDADYEESFERYIDNIDELEEWFDSLKRQ